MKHYCGFGEIFAQVRMNECVCMYKNVFLLWFVGVWNIDVIKTVVLK